MSDRIAATPARDREAAREPWTPRRSGETLTPREHAVIGIAAVGALNKEIAHELGISEQTVKNHITTILAKLGATNRVEALHVLGWRLLPEAEESLADRLLLFAAFAADLRRELDHLDATIEEIGQPEEPGNVY